MDIVAQGVGGVGLVLIIIVFQIDHRKHMLYLKICAGLMFTVHFFLLGAFTGAITNLVNVFRNVVYSQRFERKWADSILWLILFVAVFLSVGVFTWDGYPTVLPVIGMIAGTIGFWMKSTTVIRFASVIGSLSWLTYNVIVGSYAGIATELFVLGSLAVGILRFDLLKQYERCN